MLVGLIGQGACNSWSGWASLVQFLDEAIYHVACKDTSVWSVHVTRSILSRGRVVQQWLELAQTILLEAIQSKDRQQFQGFDTRLCRIEWQVFFLEAQDQSIRPIVSFLHRNLVRSHPIATIDGILSDFKPNMTEISWSLPWCHHWYSDSSIQLLIRLKFWVDHTH